MGISHKSLKGQLLLDGGKLAGSYFHRTVVLICEHTKDGAFGLVLNRPSENCLEDVLTGTLPERIRGDTLFAGGPVEPPALSYLHSDATLLNGNVMDMVSVGHNLEELIDLGNAWSPNQKLRVFAGYAGWAAGQLDDELRRESWLVHPASLDLVFDAAPGQLWRLILRSRPSWNERLLADGPDDLAFN